MRALFLSLALTAIVGVASVAEAQRGPQRPQPGPGNNVQQQVRVTLNLNDREFSGIRGGTLNLKQLINQQNRMLNLNNYDLESVTGLAKSRNGQGQIALQINGRTVAQARVAGRPADYDRRSSNTFHNFQLSNRNRNSDGNWTLAVAGQVKVRQLVVNLRAERRGPGSGPNRPEPGRPTVTKVAEGRFDKVIPDHNSHDVRVNDVQEVRIVALDKPIRIHSVTLTFSNGARVSHAINGDIVRGRDLRIPVGGRDLRGIQVVGTSLDLLGSRATYRIDVVAR